MSIMAKLQNRQDTRPHICCGECGGDRLRVRLVDLIGRRTRLACDGCGHIWDLFTILEHTKDGRVRTAA
jgi:hypothetical protein